jgi:hypothetical protein
MSLAVLADHMASKGRGPDSMLIHMSPREVQGLQALAENHGGSLTINPETGLPEAGFLDKLLPTIIGAGISYFSGGTIDPMTAAAMVGGVETVRTGDIGKGISAGLGAYGGASLTAGMTGAGADAISTPAAGDTYASLGATAITDAQALAQGFGSAEELMQTRAALAGQEAVTAAGPFESLSKGFDVAKKAGPMQYLKANAMPLAAAFGPAILAGESAESNMPKTTTGMIRPYSFDPYSGTYTSGNPYQVRPTYGAEGGLMGMDDGGYSPGQLDFTQRSEPVVRMAEGGDVKHFVIGGTVKEDIDKAYATGNYARVNELAQANKITAADVADTYKGFDASGLAAKGINLFAPPVTPPVDYGKIATDYVTTAAANPNITASDFITGAKTAGVGLTQPLETALNKSGLSLGAQYALTHADSDAGFTGGIIDARTGKPVDFYNTIGYKAGDLPGDQGGLKGLYANINYATTGLQKLIDAGRMTVQQAQDAALAELYRTDVSVNDVKAATGKNFSELFTPKKVDKVVVTGTGGTGGTTTDTGGTYTRDGTGLGGDLSTVLGLPPGVSGGGNTYVNPNGTITTRPDFSLTTNQVRDAYTKGGGSLGYEPYTPKTIEEFDTKYGSRLTGGSKQSLDYLTGKTKYSPVPYTETGEIMKPYSESVLGIPMASSKKMYLFDPATKTYKINPDYAIPTYDKDGKKSLNLTNQDVINYVKSPEYSNDDAFVSWMTANNLTPEQVAAATGMSIADVYKKIKKAKPVEAVADTSVTGQNDGGGGGGGDMADGGLAAMARGGMSQQFNLGDYSDGGRLLRGPGDGVSDSIPASIGGKRPARLADGEFVVPARIVSELGNGSTEAGARKLYAMMDRIQKARRGTVGRGRVAKNSRSEKHLPA